VLLLPQLLMPQTWIEAVHLGRFGIWRLVANAAVSVLFLPVMRLVSYRRRDWVMLALLPIWQWVIAYRIGYRALLLPLRDWSPRPDERLRVRRLDDGERWVLDAQPLPSFAGPARRRLAAARR
jgi:hypothetical protein